MPGSSWLLVGGALVAAALLGCGSGSGGGGGGTTDARDARGDAALPADRDAERAETAVESGDAGDARSPDAVEAAPDLVDAGGGTRDAETADASSDAGDASDGGGGSGDGDVEARDAGLESPGPTPDGSVADGSADTDPDTQPETNPGPHLFGLTPGTYCFDVLSIAQGFTDDCALGVATVVGEAIPSNYDPGTGIVKLGKDGALGTGPINNNMGILTRDTRVADPAMATCAWHQTNTTMFVLTSDNEFTVSAVERQSEFAAAPACSHIPTGGMCSSTWSWRLKINGFRTPDRDCRP